MAIAGDLERHERAGLLALRKVQVRNRTGRKPTDVAVAADEGVAEALFEASVPC